MKDQVSQRKNLDARTAQPSSSQERDGGAQKVKRLKSPRSGKRKSRTRNTFRISVALFCLLILYFIYGLIGPYMGNKTVNKAYQARFSTTGFYAVENALSPDRVKLLTDRTSSETAKLNIIDHATESIWLTVDDMSLENFSSLTIGALLDAAERGVNIRILIDGSNLYHKSQMYRALASHVNVEMRQYRPVHLLLPWTYNSRMNDRFLLVDDELAWFSESGESQRSGGQSGDIRGSDWDLLIYNEAANTRDTAASVLSELRNYHTALWNSKDSVPAFSKSQQLTAQAAQPLIDDSVKKWKEARSANPDYRAHSTDYRDITIETSQVTLVKNPLGEANKEPYIWFQLQKLMSEADDRVFIQTPTISMSSDMYKNMETIRANVTDVKLLTNSTACEGNFKELSDYRVNRNDLINTGVQLMEYQGTQVFVPKVLLIDQDLTVLGSYRYNQSGTYLNTESVLVIQSEVLNRQVTNLTEELAKETLIVKPDGSYNEVAQVNVRSMDRGKKFLQFVAGLGLQLFRSLL